MITLVNFGATWKNINSLPVDLELFVTNAFNDDHKAASQIFYYSTGVTAASYLEPRMFGVRMRYTFGGS